MVGSQVFQIIGEREVNYSHKDFTLNLFVAGVDYAHPIHQHLVQIGEEDGRGVENPEGQLTFEHAHVFVLNFQALLVIFTHVSDLLLVVILLIQLKLHQ